MTQRISGTGREEPTRIVKKRRKRKIKSMRFSCLREKMRKRKGLRKKMRIRSTQKRKMAQKKVQNRKTPRKISRSRKKSHSQFHLLLQRVQGRDSRVRSEVVGNDLLLLKL